MEERIAYFKSNGHPRYKIRSSTLRVTRFQEQEISVAKSFMLSAARDRNTIKKRGREGWEEGEKGAKAQRAC